MSNPNCWLIRSGGDNHLIELFAKGHVLLGWKEAGDLAAYASRDALREKLRELQPGDSEGKLNNNASVLWRFAHDVVVGDRVLTYDMAKREYLYGEVTSAYRYDAKFNSDYPHVRDVKWRGRISRDSLKPGSRNTLGSTLALFWVNSDVQEDLQQAAEKNARPSQTKQNVQPKDDYKDDFDLIRRDTREKSLELIKDRIAELSEQDLPELVAAVLRAMGFKTKVSAPGADRGVDVLASPDGLGLTEPRIKVEVKHRKGTSMGAQEVRKFLGGFRSGDRGLYVSSGGFSKEARYEAERAQFPVSLVDLDALTELVIENYEKFDAEGRSLINLVRIYLPN